MNKIALAAVGATALCAATASADSSALAFYSFKDGAVGASAANVALANAVDPATLGGTVTLFASDASAAAAFDEDAPGVRVYSSHRPDAELLCVAPQSISLQSDLTSGNRAGTISLAGAGTELSRHHDTGFTVEYFFKMEPGATWNTSGAKVKLPIYKDASTDATKTFNLYLPYSHKNMRCGVGGYTSGTPMYAQSVDFSSGAVTNGVWRHVAIVQTASGNLQVFVDRSRYYNQSVPSSLVRGEIGTDSSVELVCNAFAGKISCVRLTARELGVDDFMYASEREQVVADDGVLAFYPFDDGAAGASAVGTNKVRDAVNPVHCPGHVVKASSGTPSITWDADRPGTYVYAGKRAHKPIYVSPGSIHVTSGTTGSSGTIKFYGLGKDLSASRTNGHTVEYFLKLDDSNFTGYSPSLLYSAGYFFNGESGQNFNLYMPFAMGADYANGRQFRYSIGAYNGGHATNRNLAYDLWDGAMPHLAVVQSNSVVAGEGGAETTNRSVSVYVDGVGYNSISFDGIADVSSGNFELGNCVHHGKYSCLKVTNRALRPDEFLVARDRERAGMVITFY